MNKILQKFLENFLNILALKYIYIDHGFSAYLILSGL